MAGFSYSSEEILILPIKISENPTLNSRSPMADFSFIASSLKTVMDRERGKSRGNLGRLILAVHTVFINSGFILSNGENTPFSNHSQSQLPHLRYSPSYHSYPMPIHSVVVTFSIAEGDLVTVSASSSGDSSFYEMKFDLLKLAGPLIACLHGAIGDREERVILEFWREIESKICYPLLVGFETLSIGFQSPMVFTAGPMMIRTVPMRPRHPLRLTYLSLET